MGFVWAGAPLNMVASYCPAPSAARAAVRPVTIGGHGLVGTAWVEYEPGGVLQYRELLSAVLIRHRARPGVSIVDIWVESPASRDGGRELWGIPKELAELDPNRGQRVLRRGDLRPVLEAGQRRSTDPCHGLFRPAAWRAVHGSARRRCSSRTAGTTPCCPSPGRVNQLMTARHRHRPPRPWRRIRPNIEGFRAMAVLAVLGYHAGVTGLVGVGIDATTRPM